MNWARFNRLEPKSPKSLTCLQTITMTTECKAPTIRSSRGGWRPMGVCTMRLRSLLLLGMVLVMIGGLCRLAWAQSPTYGLGKTPTAEEIRAWDIAISPDGKELPPGSGSAKEGAELYGQKCAACHGKNGYEGRAPQLIKADPAAAAKL